MPAREDQPAAARDQAQGARPRPGAGGRSDRLKGGAQEQVGSLLSLVELGVRTDFDLTV